MKQLSLNEMLNLKGGVGLEEACWALLVLIPECWDEWDNFKKKQAEIFYNTFC